MDRKLFSAIERAEHELSEANDFEQAVLALSKRDAVVHRKEKLATPPHGAPRFTKAASCPLCVASAAQKNFAVQDGYKLWRLIVS